MFAGGTGIRDSPAPSTAFEIEPLQAEMVVYDALAGDEAMARVFKGCISDALLYKESDGQHQELARDLFLEALQRSLAHRHDCADLDVSLRREWRCAGKEPRGRRRSSATTK